MTEAGGASPGREGDARPSLLDRNRRLALAAFVAVLCAAVPIILVKGRQQWFFFDDWDFLAGRNAASLHDLFRPHNEHWSTVPILVYRVLWHFVGLRSYLPYQIVLLALHLTAGALIRALMRRAGVSPWLSTAAAALFVLFGSGRQNIVWAFQIGFVGSLVCGLAQLLLADHEGPFDRRDVLGIGFGVVGLLCSGVAISMTVAVGLAVLVRRGWRIAALHTVPLGALFGVWFLAIGHDGYSPTHSSVGATGRFTATGITNAFGRMGQIPGVGLALGILFVAGLVLAWGRLPWAELRRRAAAPAALCVAAVLFMLISGYGRAWLSGRDFARVSRYAYLITAMLLPALAVALDGLARRWRALGPVLVALLLVGIPGNVAAFRAEGIERATLGSRPLMLTLAHAPSVATLPRSLVPFPLMARAITVGWLRDGVAAGRIPKPGKVLDQTRGAVTLALSLRQTRVRPTKECSRLSRPVGRHLDVGQSLSFFGGDIRIGLVGTPGAFADYSAGLGPTLGVLGGPLTIVVLPHRGHPVLCGDGRVPGRP